MKPKINPAVLSSRNTSLSSKLCLFPRQTLRRAMDVAFKRVGPGDEPPPPPKPPIATIPSQGVGASPPYH